MLSSYFLPVSIFSGKYLFKKKLAKDFPFNAAIFRQIIACKHYLPLLGISLIWKHMDESNFGQDKENSLEG